ncbi:TPM domain-containing protein [Flavobacterium sp.]|uniref:TPM domain-containing protein n=1 Tax=Flavobacterium sp. TaxID=239 RepID=UPI002B4ADB59|nr:TPM domain-containing protein [Flavobacterium sp.]HLP65478.1 TPM domain-containing protein [Flavobacterium sp.]
MNKITAFLVILIVIGCSPKKSNAQNQQNDSLPKIESIVTDFEGILSPKEEAKLTQMIVDFEKETSVEMAIVTVQSIEPYDDIFNFSLDLANKTGVGKKGKNNGVFIVVSKQLRQVQIQNGDGIVPIISNEKTKEIVGQIMIPEFKDGHYYEGLQKGINKIMELLR